MPKEIIANVRPYETRIAVMENGKPADFFSERANTNIVGNIYKGKVMKVLQGMQSAFVDIGLGKDAFLYVEDVIANLEKMLEVWTDNGEGKSGKKGMAKGRGRQRGPIRDLLKKGENILVQVTKDRIGKKGARVTSHITLAGRYLVLMPTVNRIGISRKITSQEERSRLRDVVLGSRDPSVGYIIRTAANHCSAKEMKREIEYLQDLWKAVTSAADDDKTGVGLIHSELDLMQRVLRDVFDRRIARVVIDDEDAYAAAVDFVQRNQKELANRVKLHTGKKSIFVEFGIEEMIESALCRKVMLRSGGHIVIQQTEALVSIDVNTGRFVGTKSLEDTALKTNLDAVREIVNQIRIRDLGGIIVIDYIDMERKANRDTLIERFNKELLRDKAEKTVLKINEFGLIAMTRKRTRKSLERMSTRPCPYCDGTAVVKNHETVSCEVLRELEKIAQEGVRGNLRVVAHPEVSEYLAGEMSQYLEEIRKSYKLEISLLADEHVHHEQFDIFEEA
ncbi:MAG TPA: Rne/Rng family ribonuclease [Acidobacteriota bacterium]|nr:Rne/Rng family ribonuclease [Acidobacteriota bacterium]